MMISCDPGHYAGILFNRQPLTGSITSRPCSTLTMIGVSVLNPASSSQLPFRHRIALQDSDHYDSTQNSVSSGLTCS